MWAVLPKDILENRADASNQVVDIFNGDIGNNLDIPGPIASLDLIVLDCIAIYPELLTQIIVNTTRYFQDPDNVSRLEG